MDTHTHTRMQSLHTHEYTHTSLDRSRDGCLVGVLDTSASVSDWEGPTYVYRNAFDLGSVKIYTFFLKKLMAFFVRTCAGAAGVITRG